MKIADEIREILTKAIYGTNYTYEMLDVLSKRDVDQTLKEILKLKVKLPAKKENQAVSEYYSGYNQALEDVSKLNSR